MPIIEGVGDELVYAALVAAPILIIFRSHTLHTVRQGLCTAGGYFGRFCGFWGTIFGRGTIASSESEEPSGCAGNSFSPPENDCCSICHDSFALPCQANCAHWFCGDCILRVWQHTSALQPCRCPICRRHINLLIPSESNTNGDPEAQRVLHEIANYNRVHGGGSVGILQHARDMPLLLRRMLHDLMDPERALPLVHRTRIITYSLLLAFYVFNPLDILPEGIIGVIGLLDDILVMVLVMFHLAAMYRSQYASSVLSFIGI